MIYEVHWKQRSVGHKTYIKQYTNKRDAYDDVQIAWDKGWYPEFLTAGVTTACICSSLVYGPKWIGSCYKQMKIAFEVLPMLARNAGPQPHIDLGW